jgi:hypothetical protein
MCILARNTQRETGGGAATGKPGLAAGGLEGMKDTGSRDVAPPWEGLAHERLGGRRAGTATSADGEGLCERTILAQKQALVNGRNQKLSLFG